MTFFGWFKRLFPDPGEEAFERKLRITQAIKRCDQEVKKQDGFIRRNIDLAVRAKQTSDPAAYAQARKMLAFAVETRRRAQRGYNQIRVYSSMADQMEAQRDFCIAMKDISKSIAETMSAIDMREVQSAFAKGVAEAQRANSHMDGLLDSFDSSFDASVHGSLDEVGVSNDDLDALIGQLAAEGGSVNPAEIGEILDRAESRSSR